MEKMTLSEAQKVNFEERKTKHENTAKPDRKYTKEEIILKFLEEAPDKWFFTWELMGSTKWGWLSHATHAALRKAEQKGLIWKDYIGKYVVYTHKG